MKDPVQEDIKKILIETGKRLRKRANGPSPDMLSSLSKLGNTYYKLKYVKGGPTPGKQPGRSPASSTPSRDDFRTEKEWNEFCFQNGTPGFYESLLK